MVDLAVFAHDVGAFTGVLKCLDQFELVLVRFVERVVVASEPEIGSQELSTFRFGEPVFDVLRLFVDSFEGEGKATAGHIVLEPESSSSNVVNVGDLFDPQELFLDPFRFVGIFDFGGWGFGPGFFDIGQEGVEGFVVGGKSISEFFLGTLELIPFVLGILKIGERDIESGGHGEERFLAGDQLSFFQASDGFTGKGGSVSEVLLRPASFFT